LNNERKFENTSCSKEQKFTNINPINSPILNNYINKPFLSINRNQETTKLNRLEKFLDYKDKIDYRKSLENFDRAIKPNLERNLLVDFSELNNTYHANVNNKCCSIIQKQDNNNNNNLISKKISINKNCDLKNAFNQMNNSKTINTNRKSENLKSKNPKKFDILSLLNNTASGNFKNKKIIDNRINNTNININENNLNHLATTRAQNKPFFNIINNYDKNQNYFYENFEKGVLFTDSEINNDGLNNKDNKNTNSRLSINNYNQNFKNQITNNFNDLNNEISNDNTHSSPYHNKYNFQSENSSVIYNNSNLDFHKTNENIEDFENNYKNNFKNIENTNLISNRETNKLNPNKVLGLLNSLNSKNTNAKIRQSVICAKQDFNNQNNFYKKVPNLNLQNTQSSHVMKKNNPYSQSNKNLPNEKNLNINSTNKIIDKYLNISPLYKNLPRNKLDNEVLFSTRNNTGNFKRILNSKNGNNNKNNNINENSHRINNNYDPNNNSNINFSSVNNTARVNSILNNNKTKNLISSNGSLAMNKNIQNLDFKQFFDSSALLYNASSTSKNLNNKKNLIGYDSNANRPISNKNIQINNNIIINSGDSIPLTMNFNYDYNGEIFIDNKNDFNGIRCVRGMNDSNCKKNINKDNINKIYENEKLNYYDNQCKYDESEKNFYNTDKDHINASRQINNKNYISDHSPRFNNNANFYPTLNKDKIRRNYNDAK